VGWGGEEEQGKGRGALLVWGPFRRLVISQGIDRTVKGIWRQTVFIANDSYC
jgi:hypothetical protein